MAIETHIPTIGAVIQLAVAPVFLLTAIGALLGVLTSRLARAVDRARSIENRLPSLRNEALQLALDELRVISRRTRWVNRAISASTACAILICLVVATLFASAFLATDLSALAGTLFVLALVALTLGLLSLLREVFLASRHLRIGEHRPGL
jgi:hypothetical protein